MNDFFETLSTKGNKRDIIKSISRLPSNYVGSKRRLLPYIWDVLEKNNIQFDSVFDAFSGSALVSLLFKHMGKRVFCNDLLTSSSITAICLLENEKIPLTKKDLRFLYHNIPDDCGTFVLDNYKDKFFTEKECKFLDRYRRNVELLCGEKFYCGLELLKQTTLASIPNSNFTLYSKDLKLLRSTHTIGESFWTEKWRDTTRKRRDDNNEIMFGKGLNEIYLKYKGAFSLFVIENHINQHCFLGGRYYNGQTIANLFHRIKHKKSKGKEINEIPLSLEKFKKALIHGLTSGCVFNSDIIDLLGANIIQTDLIYIDPPYGSASSDYAHLYSFLEEYLYECSLKEMEHIQRGAKRFTKNKGYQEQFENLLSLCGNFETWLISYNDSSYANLDIITSTIKNAGKSNVQVFNVPITYQYRKGKNINVDTIEDFYESGYKSHKYSQRGVEYLILAA